MSVRQDAGAGLMLVHLGVESDGSADFDQWHLTEHVPERLGVPGFRSGRRYIQLKPESTSGLEEYLVYYELDSIAVLASADYLARLDSPTPWTKLTVGKFRSERRQGYHVIESVGRGVGATLIWADLPSIESIDAADFERIAEQARRLAPSLISARASTPDHVATSARDTTVEGRQYGGPLPTKSGLALVFEVERPDDAMQLWTSLDKRGSGDVLVGLDLEADVRLFGLLSAFGEVGVL
jgi:hypothetical protein